MRAIYLTKSPGRRVVKVVWESRRVGEWEIRVPPPFFLSPVLPFTMWGLIACLAIILAVADSHAQEPVPAPGPRIPEGILVFESEDGRSRWWFDFRVQLDAAFYIENKNPMNTGTELRRGRMAVKSILRRNWYAEFDIDFVDSEVDVKDAYIGYLWRRTSLRVGQFREPFGLEKVTSSRYITFMERSLPLLPGGLPVGRGSRKIGLAVSGYGDHWSGMGGVFGQDIGDVDEGDDEGFAVTGRGVFAPIKSAQRTLHLGLAGTIRTPDANATGSDQVRFRVRPETHVNRARFLNTERITGVDYMTALGLEGALALGPLSLQSEFIVTHIHRSGGQPDAGFEGGYIFASWFPTGESRNYDIRIGEFHQVIPQRTSGAWELGLRYSTLDLNDFGAGILGGEAENVTLGVNWYAGPHVRVMANATYVNNDRRADGGSPTGPLVGGDDFGFFQMRFQVQF